MVYSLRWEGHREPWGYSEWKAYFEEDLMLQVSFLFSRVSCHVDLRTWVKNMEFPWKFSILGRCKFPPIGVDRKLVTKRALSWLRVCFHEVLKRAAVIFSIEDDLSSGMPEDIDDGVPIETLKAAFMLLAPEPVSGIPHFPHN